MRLPLAPEEIRRARDEPQRYRIVGPAPDRPEFELGRGGVGRVLLAIDERTRREVALKELLPAPDGSIDPAADARFLREARVAAQLEHPCIVPIHDIGRWDDGRPFFTMRAVRGRTLAEALDLCRDLPERLRLLPHVLDLAGAIGYAHGRGVVHRDLKPDNVLIGPSGETVVVDWGFARPLGCIAGDRPRPCTATADRSCTCRHPTLDGEVTGTPGYLAPEQAEGKNRDVDARTDVWGIGAVLYELLTGSAPAAASSSDEAIRKSRLAAILPVREREPLAPVALARVVERALCRGPDERFPRVAELVAALVAAHEVPLAHLRLSGPRPRT